MTLKCDIDLWFSRANFELTILQGGPIDINDWMNGMWGNMMLDPFWDLELRPHPWSWPCISKVKFRNCRISGIGGSNDKKRKGLWVDRMLHPLFDLELWSYPWPLPWIFKVIFWNSHIDIEQKGCESIRWWTQITFNFDLIHDLDLRFSRSNFERILS